ATALSSLSLHDALPISGQFPPPVVQLVQLNLHLAGAIHQPGPIVQFDGAERQVALGQHPALAVVQLASGDAGIALGTERAALVRSEEHTSELQSRENLV